MRHLLAALLAAFMVLAGCVPTARSGNEELFEVARSAAWAVYIRDVGSLTAKCSASAYRHEADATWLVTAGHCFWPPDEKTDFLVTRDHKKFEDAALVANGYYYDAQGRQRGDDWAVITIKGRFPIVALGDSKKLRLGEDVLMVGVPFGLDFLAVQGIIGSLSVSLSGMDWNRYLGVNAYIASGNSGTGVISIAQRAIIGIVVAGPGPQTNLAIATPIHLLDVAAARARGRPR